MIFKKKTGCGGNLSPFSLPVLHKKGAKIVFMPKKHPHMIKESGIYPSVTPFVVFFGETIKGNQGNPLLLLNLAFRCVYLTLWTSMSHKYLLHFIARGITTAAHLSLQIFSSNPYGSFCLSYISRILNMLTTIHSRQSIRTKGGASFNSSRGSSETRVNMNYFKNVTGL